MRVEEMVEIKSFDLGRLITKIERRGRKRRSEPVVAMASGRPSTTMTRLEAIARKKTAKAMAREDLGRVRDLEVMSLMKKAKLRTSPRVNKTNSLDWMKKLGVMVQKKRGVRTIIRIVRM